MPGLSSDAAPSIVYKFDDAQLWLFARDSVFAGLGPHATCRCATPRRLSRGAPGLEERRRALALLAPPPLQFTNLAYGLLPSKVPRAGSGAEGERAMKEPAVKQVRYAVVGAGNIAQVAILPAFAHATENSELVAIVTGDREKREALGRRYRVATGSYEQLEQVLRESRVDAAYISLPNHQHREFTERAARAGVHVLCEKPMAPTVEDCQAMIQVCEEHRVRLMIAYRLHFEEANLRAIEIARSGEIGEPRLFTSIFSQQVRPDDIRTKAELGGGALFDMGIYCINAARNLFRGEPEEVVATSFQDVDARFHGADATTTAILHFTGGRVAQLTASLAAAAVSSYRLVGTAGDLRVEPAYEYTTGLTHHLTLDGKTTCTTFAPRDQFAPEIVHFSRCVLEGSEPEPSGEEGLADVRVMQAILDAAKQRKAVSLTPFLRRQRPDLRQEMRKPPVGEQQTIHAPSPSAPR